jgi:hypothetical protein
MLALPQTTAIQQMVPDQTHLLVPDNQDVIVPVPRKVLDVVLATRRKNA